MSASPSQLPPSPGLARGPLGELAQMIEPVAGSTPAIEVERLFADSSALGSIVVACSDGRLEVLTRRRFLNQMAGRLGYGRPLHHRRPVERLALGSATLVLAADSSLEETGEAALEREREHRYDDVVVRFPDGALGIVTVAELFAALSRLNHHRALHDALTGLPNRALFFESLRRACERPLPSAGDLAVLFLDLDDFKAVNDSLGHETGDDLLGRVARRLSAGLRSGDLIARLGGDEFGIVLTGTSTAAARATAERLIAALAEPIAVTGRDIPVSASIGIAVRHGSESAEALVRDADTAMYRAKRAGKGRVACFEPDMHANAVARLDIEMALRGATHRGELGLAYQPIVDLAGGEIVAVEALLRWTHPELGAVSPATFVPAAERSGAIVELGRWALSSACAEAAGWARDPGGGDPPTIAVNVSVVEATQQGFVAAVERVLAESGLPPSRLALEITESVLLQEGGEAAIALTRLSATGIKIVVDDFGTGYSSFGYLQRIPLESLKIDRSFVAGIGDGGPEQTIVSGMIGMARGLGLEVVAEGVETRSQVTELLRRGCRRAQGYLFASPLPAERVRELIHGAVCLDVAGCRELRAVAGGR